MSKNLTAAVTVVAPKTTDAALPKTAARALTKPYAETDSTLAARVTSLVPYVVGKGMSVRDVIRAVESVLPAAEIPSGFTVATISRAANVARAMHDTTTNLPADLSKSATDGIAAALMRIVSRENEVGGGSEGVTRAIAAAVDGTANGAEIAERLTAEAVAVAERSVASRREKRAVTQPPRNAGGTTSRPAALTPATTPAATGKNTEQAPAPAPAATPAQVARNLETGVMLAELLRRFSQTGVTVTSGTPAAKAAKQRRAAKATAPATPAAPTLVDA